MYSATATRKNKIKKRTFFACCLLIQARVLSMKCYGNALKFKKVLNFSKEQKKSFVSFFNGFPFGITRFIIVSG